MVTMKKKTTTMKESPTGKKPIASPLGLRIRRAYRELEWTRADLWRATDIPYTSLRNIDSNKKTVKASEDYLLRIATALDIPFDELRILAGYKIKESPSLDVGKQRLMASLGGHPELERALTRILDRNDQKEIDRATAILEWNDREEFR
jgi:hypothetical protein